MAEYLVMIINHYELGLLNQLDYSWVCCLREMNGRFDQCGCTSKRNFIKGGCSYALQVGCQAKCINYTPQCILCGEN